MAMSLGGPFWRSLVLLVWMCGRLVGWGPEVQVPGLAVVIVGCRKDSQSYVAMKRKACAEVGIRSFDFDLPEDIPEADVIRKVHELNKNPEVHGEPVQSLFSS